MNSARAFRYELSDPSSLGELVAGVRAALLGVFTRRYGQAVGDELAWRIDLHCAGVRQGSAGGNPFKESLSHIRDLAAGGNSLDLFPAIRFHLVGSEALLSVESGGQDYIDALSGYPGLVDDGTYPGTPPDGMTPAQAARREASWAAIQSSPLGKGLLFSLVEGSLPAMRFASARRYLPAFEARCRRTARALILKQKTGAPFPSDGPAARDFKRHLATARGKDELDRQVARLARLLPRAFDQDSAQSYPTPRPIAKATRQPAAPRVPMDAPRSIDHADVLESSDGRIFVAVLYAGLSNEDRLHIQVTERQMAFVQNGISFGGVVDVPQSAIDLLRRSSEAIVVEVRKGGAEREVKARHVAVVRDDSLNGALDTAMMGLRNFAARTRAKQAAWMEN